MEIEETPPARQRCRTIYFNNLSLIKN